MKEVYDISLQGAAFKIEKDAYVLLENYLEELKSHYGKQEEEVVNDIEERIAELLLEKGCTGGTVVQSRHIDDIIKLCENNVGGKFLTPNKNIKVTVIKGRIEYEKLS